MDFLKRHYEKLVLAVALLVLIGTAGYLAKKVNELGQQVQNAPLRPPRKGKLVPPVSIESYQQVLVRLRKPSLWTNSPATMFPSFQMPNVDTGMVTAPPPPKATIVLRQVVREAFRLRFDAYTWNAVKREAHAFQINSLTSRRTFFIESLGQPVPEVGESNRFVLVKFEQKTAKVAVPGMEELMEKDVSELTLQRSGGDPVVLVLGRVSEPNPVAVVQCGTDPNLRHLRAGGQFECNSRTYKVVDIAPTQMVIEDLKNRETQAIPLTP
jgi:hypothetical protein